MKQDAFCFYQIAPIKEIYTTDKNKAAKEYIIIHKSYITKSRLIFF